MKPIITEKQDQTILTSKINKNHIVVGIIEGYPAILHCEEYRKLSTLSFLSLYSSTILGKSYGNIGLNSIKEVVEYRMKNGDKIEVFLQKNWKEALQWLIDNA